MVYCDPREYGKIKAGEVWAAAKRINHYLEKNGLPQQGVADVEDLLSSTTGGTTREALRELLLVLRYTAHENLYGWPPNALQLSYMRQRSEEDADRADLGGAL